MLWLKRFNTGWPGHIAIMGVFSAGAVLFLGAASCLSQVTADKQAELAAHMQKAKGYLEDKQPALAIPELQAAVAIDPENVDAQANLGVLLFFQGRAAESIPHFRAALARQPDLAKIQGLLGLAESRTQDIADARKDMEAALPLLQDRRFQTQVGLELISIDTQNGDLENAAAVIAQLRKADSDSPEILYAAYRTYTDLADEAVISLSLSAPDSAQMHQVLAHEDTRRGNTDGAIEQYRKAIVIDPHLPGIHFELAELLRMSQDAKAKQEAGQEYRAALKENPRDEKSIFRLAEIDEQAGNTDRSFAEYTKAVELQPADADAKLGLAKILIEMNQTDKALALLEESVRLEPTNPTTHYRLGSLYRKMGRTEDAKREIDLYLKLKEAREKLRVIYKQLQIQPKETPADEQDDK
jgi:tetratricopeptide (TPR) repeat protein